MAKIKQYIKESADIGKKISEVNCTYKIGYINDEKIVAFSTYGSDKRKNDGASQVLHFDKESAQKIIDILKEEFDL